MQHSASIAKSHPTRHKINLPTPLQISNCLLACDRYKLKTSHQKDFYLGAIKHMASQALPQTEVCLLGGHRLDMGAEIAQCAICDQKGCPDCLDSHDCKDHETETYLQ
jgi:hypothetical protein